jgi:hypothetical protein
MKMDMTCRWCGRSMSSDGSFWTGGYCGSRCRSEASANSKVTSWSIRLKGWLTAALVIGGLYVWWGPHLTRLWEFAAPLPRAISHPEALPIAPVPPAANNYSQGARQQSIPQFRDFPAGEIFVGTSASVKLTNDSDRAFRSRLKEASRQPPNFAGHYVLTTWGCGTECIMGAAVDVVTGNVVWLPASICCAQDIDKNFQPIVARINSRLIVLSGIRNEKDGDDAAHFYSVEGDSFVFVADVPRSRP